MAPPFPASVGARLCLYLGPAPVSGSRFPGCEMLVPGACRAAGVGSITLGCGGALENLIRRNWKLEIIPDRTQSRSWWLQLWDAVGALLLPAQGQGFLPHRRIFGGCHLARHCPEPSIISRRDLAAPACPRQLKRELMKPGGHERAWQELIKGAEHGVLTARILEPTGLKAWSGKEENWRGYLEINLQLFLFHVLHGGGGSFSHVLLLLGFLVNTECLCSLCYMGNNPCGYKKCNAVDNVTAQVEKLISSLNAFCIRSYLGSALKVKYWCPNRQMLTSGLALREANNQQLSLFLRGFKINFFFCVHLKGEFLTRMDMLDDCECWMGWTPLFTAAIML